MKLFSTAILLLALSNIVSSCTAQTSKNIMEDHYGITKKVSAIDTSSAWDEPGLQILLTGSVLKPDQKTPAAGVLLYYYQTNTEGRYLHKPEEKRSMVPNELGQTHGYIRGWLVTDSLGKYFIYTIKPGSYPTRTEAAHVHVTIKESANAKEYYVDDFVFDDDVLLTAEKRQRLENRAGSGIVKLVRKGNVQIGERNFILGLNIPGYSQKAN